MVISKYTYLLCGPPAEVYEYKVVSYCNKIFASATPAVEKDENILMKTWGSRFGWVDALYTMLSNFWQKDNRKNFTLPHCMIH